MTDEETTTHRCEKARNLLGRNCSLGCQWIRETQVAKLDG